MSVLIAAATAAEARACRSGIERAGLASEFEILTTGIGPSRAERTLADWLRGSQRQARLVVSSGFAGSWSKEIVRGQWVSARRLWLEKDSEVHPIEWLRAEVPTVLGIGACDWVTVTELSPEPPSRFPLANPTSLVVDMESAVLADVAARHRIPFLALRMISDCPSAKLPRFLVHFTRAATGAPGWNRWHGLVGALRDPGASLRFAQEAWGWTRMLREGWETLAPVLVGKVRAPR